MDDFDQQVPVPDLDMAENALRTIIRDVLQDSWLSDNGALSRAVLGDRQANEQKKRPGVVLSADPLDYTYTSQLVKIVKDDSEAFSAVFPRFTEISGMLDFLTAVRNTVAHGRQLVPYERHLLVGLTGYLLNHSAIYRTKEDPAKHHYPSIASITDNFGNNTRWMTAPGEPRLTIGDTVTFNCQAWDIENRPVEWILEISTMSTPAFGTPVSELGRETASRRQIGTSAQLVSCAGSSL